MKWARPWMLLFCGLLMASCAQVLVQPQKASNVGPVTSSLSLNPSLGMTPTPANQLFPGLTPAPLGTVTPYPTPNPIVTPYSYVKEHVYTDLESNGQRELIIVAGDRKPSPPVSPTPALQYQKGEDAANFVYNLQIWKWDQTTNQYSLSDSWPNDPTRRFVDMRYNLADLTGDGTEQILVQARVGGVGEALDYEVFRVRNGKLQGLFAQSGLEHGQVRIVGKNLWQQQAVRAPNEDPCCPGLYRSDAFIWNGSQFVPSSAFAFPTFSHFPAPTPTALSLQATPVPLNAVSVPVPAR